MARAPEMLWTRHVENNLVSKINEVVSRDLIKYIDLIKKYFGIVNRIEVPQNGFSGLGGIRPRLWLHEAPTLSAHLGLENLF